MRSFPRLAVCVTLVAIVVAGGLAVRALADEQPSPTPKEPAGAGGTSSGAGAAPTGSDPLAAESMLRRIELLELQTTYLASRERSLTADVLDMKERGAPRDGALRRVRGEGFTAGAISAPSRESLVAGLEGLARDLQRELPALSKEEERYLAEIRSRQAGRD
jgi:hypothetical protein